MAAFMTAIKEARADAQKLAKSVPHIFPEWQRLQHARRELEKAAAEHAEALAAWDKIKKDGEAA